MESQMNSTVGSVKNKKKHRIEVNILLMDSDLKGTVYVIYFKLRFRCVLCDLNYTHRFGFKRRLNSK